MALNAIKAIAGIAKQPARGTLAANPTFAHGLTGGAPVQVEPKQEEVADTSASRTTSKHLRSATNKDGEIPRLPGGAGRVPGGGHGLRHGDRNSPLRPHVLRG